MDLTTELDQSQMETCATTPFDHAKADIILRSADGVEFRVFTLFLSLASPVFKTLFGLPQAPDATTNQETKDGLAVIAVSEDSKTLDSFLRFCYPSALAEDPSLENLTDVLSVLAAARKYSLDLIERKVCQALVNPKVLETEPLRCFAISRNARLKHETIIAARHTLRQPLIPAKCAEIDLITASDLLALLTYHKNVVSPYKPYGKVSHGLHIIIAIRKAAVGYLLQGTVTTAVAADGLKTDDSSYGVIVQLHGGRHISRRYSNC